MTAIKTALSFAVLMLVIGSLPFLTSAAGEIDPTFNPALIHVKTNSINRTVVRRVAVLPDGKVLIAGLFRAVHTSSANCIVRLNPGGTVDPTFRAPEIRAVIGALQPRSSRRSPCGRMERSLSAFRPSTRFWYQLRTSGGFFAMQF